VRKQKLSSFSHKIDETVFGYVVSFIRKHLEIVRAIRAEEIIEDIG
jgi:hypothetical protein